MKKILKTNKSIRFLFSKERSVNVMLHQNINTVELIRCLFQIEIVEFLIENPESQKYPLLKQAIHKSNKMFD
jgi:hypothetical protein